jgi:hypothetical protein
MDFDAVHPALLGVAGADGVGFDDLVDVLELHLLGHLEVERARGVGRSPQRALGERRVPLTAAVAELHDDAGAVRVDGLADLAQAGHDLG